MDVAARVADRRRCMSLRGIVPPDPETGVSQEYFAVIFTHARTASGSLPVVSRYLPVGRQL